MAASQRPATLRMGQVRRTLRRFTVAWLGTAIILAGTTLCLVWTLAA